MEHCGIISYRYTYVNLLKVDKEIIGHIRHMTYKDVNKSILRTGMYIAIIILLGKAYLFCKDVWRVKYKLY